MQQWIDAGKRCLPPPGEFRSSPFQVALGTRFHSLIEVFLQAGVEQCDRNWALAEVTHAGKLELVQLLHDYGADLKTVDALTVVQSRNPALIRWFIDHGLDLEAGNPIAEAFRWRHREFLGIYMGIRDRVPSARRQAAVALRHHVIENNLKWASLFHPGHFARREVLSACAI